MTLELRGVNFGSVFNTAGARNFFGEADKIGGDWRQHKPFHLIPGYDWNGVTFISKTTTLGERSGNLDLHSDLQPKKFLPSCIYVDWFKGVALNDISLSGPGAVALLNLNSWQNFTEPLLISFMSAAETAKDRLKETTAFCGIIKRLRYRFKVRFGLEFNDSCPNAGHDPQVLITEAAKKLRAARQILPDVPIFWKINALTSPWEVKEVIDTGYGDAISVSNTIPWLQNATWTSKPETQIDWLALFGDPISPLERRGFSKGGLSGWPLINLVVEWVTVARQIGITLPIKAEGGIQKKNDISRLAVVGANAIGLGSVSFLRPWRLKGLINYGNSVLGVDDRRIVPASCHLSQTLHKVAEK